MNANINTNINTNNIPTATELKAKATREAVLNAYVDGLVDCYIEARNAYEIRMDMARDMELQTSQQYVEFLDHMMQNVSAEEFEGFIESEELLAADRISCIALFAKHNLPEDYTGENDDGEIGEGFNGREELDKMINAHCAGDQEPEYDVAALANLMAQILKNKGF